MSNPFYETSGSPVSRSRGRSDVIRDEYALIERGFDNVNVEIYKLVTKLNPTSTGVFTHTGTATFSGELNVPTPPITDDSTKAASTAWVRALLGTTGGGGSGEPLPPKVGKGGSLLATDGTTNYWQDGASAAAHYALLQQGII